MTSLFTSYGLTDQFHIFHQAQHVTVRPQRASEDINCLTNLFDQIATTDLTLSESFKVMFILEWLPTEFYNFCSTVALTTELTQFTVNTIMTKILAKVSMLSSRRSLKSCISQVETLTSGVLREVQHLSEMGDLLKSVEVYTPTFKRDLLSMIRKIRIV